MAENREFREFLPLRLKRILFATNFTGTSGMALPYAAAWARRFNAEIVATHVIPEDAYAHLVPEKREAECNAMKQAARVRIEGLLTASRFRDISFRVLVDHGDVIRVLASQVRAEQIDLIVAGSEGRHGLQKLWSPPVEEEIAVAADCPVLLVGPEVGIDPEEEVQVERILHPTELKAQSRRALEYAYALAETYGARLCLMHVAEDVWKEPLSTRMTAEAFCRMRLLESELPKPADGSGPEFLVEFGSPERLILEAAQRQATQLIVIGVPQAAHPVIQSRLPGPLAYDVATHALCPVLAVRDGAGKGRR